MSAPRASANWPADAGKGAARHLEIPAVPDAGPGGEDRVKRAEVQEGQALATVEAMKMENILKAERKGVVKAIKASAGASLKVDDVIMEFE
jgi:pyruvate carboxylase